MNGGTLGTLVQDAQNPKLYTAQFTPTPGFQGNGSVSVTAGKFTDADGNANDASTVNAAFVVDTVAPSLAIGSDKALAAGQSATITFTFDEAPSGFTSASVVAQGGTLLNLAPTTDPKVYTATFIPATNTQNVAALIEVAAGAYTDAAGNDGAAASLALNGDTLVPTLTIGADSTTLKAGEQTTLTFSEIPQDFVAGDIAVTGGTLSGFAVSADPNVYTATFTPAASNALAASVSVPGGAYTDAIGNAGAASNTVNIGGGTLAPSVVGSAGGNDRIYGDEGNDIVFGGQGDDYIDGGTGRDTLRLMGASRAEYTMRIKDGAVVMTHLKPDADGTDIVANVELLQYAGQAGTVDFNQSEIAGLVRMYSTAFGRNADTGGINFWIEAHEKGLSMMQIAHFFMASDEGKADFGTLSNRDFVTRLYDVAMHRVASAGEVDFWTNHLDRGALDRGEVLYYFTTSEEKADLVGVVTTSIITT